MNIQVRSRSIRARLFNGGWTSSGPNVWHSPRPSTHELLLQSTILDLSDRTNDGRTVIAVQLPWYKIAEAIRNDPNCLAHFSKHARAFEEFLAGVYAQAGYETQLTPPSNDGGRDVIAIKSGFCSVRILGQSKAYSPGHLVTHNDVRAMLGVLLAEPSASKGVIVTTSDFQPGVKTVDQIQQFVPTRLELINGTALRDWVTTLDSMAPNNPSPISDG